MRQGEHDVVPDEVSPFLGDAPLRIGVRPRSDSFAGEELFSRLETPWLGGQTLFSHDEQSATEPFTNGEIWTGTSDQLDFRKRVLSEHIARSKKSKGEANRDLRRDELEQVRGTEISIKRGAAEAASRLIEAANAALEAASTAGDADALRTKRISATSGYRGKDHQLQVWLTHFKKYYDKTQTAREALASGPHSNDAVVYMLAPKRKGGFNIPGKVAAPGYSNHQAGIAIDLWQERTPGHRIPNDTDEKLRKKWRGTWFHKWLKSQAATFGFVWIATEEWHWEFKPDEASKLQDGESPDTELEAQEGEGCGDGEIVEEDGADSTMAPSVSARGASQEPPGQTIYQPIDLRIGTVTVQVLIQKEPEKKYTPVRVAVKPKTGIFVPEGYRAGEKLDLIIYLHGHTTSYPGRNVSIDGYWSDRKRLFPLREQLNESGKNAVLVAPTLGPHSEAGSLDDARGLDTFVSKVLLGLVRKSPAFHNLQPQVGDIILAGHSGAGTPMLNIALSRSPMAARIRECWLFDALYGDVVSRWGKWIREHPDAMFYNYHAGKSPTKNSRDLELAMKDAKVTNAVIFPSVEMSDVKMPEHFEVPRAFFLKRLRETSWLQDRSSTVTKQKELSGWELDEALDEEELEDQYVEDGELGLSEEEEEAESDSFEEVEHSDDEAEDDEATNDGIDREAPLAEYQAAASWTPCFSAGDIAKVQEVYRQNADAANADKYERCSCIVMLNVALGQLLALKLKSRVAHGKTKDRPQSKRIVQIGALTTKTIEKAMEQLQDRGYILNKKVVDFFDSKSRTAGTCKPVRLKASVQDIVLAASQTGCWSAFGMSIMDGYHSVLLLVDHTGIAATIYWFDQFFDGVNRDVTTSLDTLITDKTLQWWQKVTDEKHIGSDTMTRLWQLQKPLKAS